jgi:hypothetical protein
MIATKATLTRQASSNFTPLANREFTQSSAFPVGGKTNTVVQKQKYFKLEVR